MWIKMKKKLCGKVLLFFKNAIKDKKFMLVASKYLQVRMDPERSRGSTLPERSEVDWTRTGWGREPDPWISENRFASDS